jgi:hypothetical protein
VNYDVHLTFEGDPALAAQWAGFAKKKAREFGVQCSTTKQSHRTTWYHASPEVSIKIRYSNGLQYAHIVTQSGFILSGLAAPTLTFSGGKFRMNQTQLDSVVERTTGGFTALIGEEKLKDIFKSDKASYAYGADLIDSTAGNYLPALNNSPIIKSPSKYTGEMRKVVQCMHGMGLVVPFEFQFNRCHGIYTASDGGKWVIEISDRGIHAARLKMRGGADALPGYENLAPTFDLGYLPSGNATTIPYTATALAAAVEDGSVLQLLSAAGVADFYALSPFFSDCGWAFSYSGAEAQNTGWAMDVTDTWIESYRFKVVFTDVAGIPSVSSFTEVEQGYLHGDRVTHFKVPESRLGGVVSFDIFHSEFSSPGDHDTTFYVFYDGETAKLCKYFSARDVSTTVYSDDISGSDPLAVHVIESAGVYPWPGTTRKNGTETIRQPAEVYVSSADGSVATSFTGTIKNFFVQHWGTPSYLHSSGLTGNLVPDSGANCVHKLSGGTESSGATYTATIPYGDREAIYIYKQESTTRSGMIEDQNGYGICCGDERQVVRNGHLSVYGIVYASTSGYPEIITGVIYEYSSFGNLQAALYPCPMPTASGPPPTPNVAIGAGVPGIATIAGGTADTVKTRTDTLVFHGSLIGQSSIFSNRDIKEDYPTGSTEWAEYVSDPVLPAGNVDNYQFYHAVADAFTGYRIISSSDDGISEANYHIVGVDAGYQPAYSGSNRDRFFFGAP